MGDRPSLANSLHKQLSFTAPLCQLSTRTCGNTTNPRTGSSRAKCRTSLCPELEQELWHKAGSRQMSLLQAVSVLAPNTKLYFHCSVSLHALLQPLGKSRINRELIRVSEELRCTWEGGKKEITRFSDTGIIDSLPQSRLNHKHCSNRHNSILLHAQESQ